MTTSTLTNDKTTFDVKMMKLVEDATANTVDKTVTLETAKLIFAEARDGGKYTEVEKNTIAHIRSNHTWSKEADEWYHTEVRKWAASN
ncbi:MAG: hypothetical protein IPP83_12775 [Flavobacteriales bacterium]|nr:hypothetical protein [Flavobacteriales bacterium]